MKKQLRDVGKDDSEVLFDWRNHPSARNNSFDKSMLSLPDHKKWFENLIRSSSSLAYILEVDQVPVGAIRFDIEDTHSAEINYLIDPSKQGQGFGTTILCLGLNKVFKDNSELTFVYGYVLQKNLASIRIFEKLSFKRVSGDSSKLKFVKFK